MARVRPQADIKLLDIVREINGLTDTMLGSVIYMLVTEDTSSPHATAPLSESKIKKSILLVDQLIQLSIKFDEHDKTKLIEQLRDQLNEEISTILIEAASFKVDEILAKLEIISGYLTEENPLKNIVDALHAVTLEVYQKRFTHDKRLAARTIRASKESVYKKMANLQDEDFLELDVAVNKQLQEISIKKAYDELRQELMDFQSYLHLAHKNAATKEIKSEISDKISSVFRMTEIMLSGKSDNLSVKICKQRMQQCFDILQEQDYIEKLTKSDKPAARFINNIIKILNKALGEHKIKFVKSKHAKEFVTSTQSLFTRAGLDKEEKKKESKVEAGGVEKDAGPESKSERKSEGEDTSEDISSESKSSTKKK